MDSALNLVALMEESNPEESRELLRTLAQRGYGKAAVNEAWNLVDEGRTGKAEAILTTLLANPESVDTGLVEGTLGTILTRDGRPELAEPYRASAAHSVPWARADWGHLLLARGDADPAVQVWTRGMDNDEVESMVPLANHLSDVGEKAQAERVYRRAIELGDAYAATNLAIDLWDSGEKDEARELFKQADLMGDPVAHSWLASNADET